MTKLLAVFGNPVLHSKSPQLHNAVLSVSHIDAYYTRIHVEKCEDVIKTIRQLNIFGANITTPFKENLLPMLDSLSTEAELIGAVNTIRNENGVLTGYNTDYLGVIKSIEEVGENIFGKRCLVLGAGGASKAAVYGLMSAGGEVFITNRTQSKADEIARLMGCVTVPLSDLDELMPSIDIVVSTLLPDVSMPNFRWNSRVKLLLDANYRKSTLCEEAEAAGIRVVKGDRWLIHQAVGAFSIFAGYEPSVEMLSQAIQVPLDGSILKIKSVELGESFSLDERYDFIVATEGLSDIEVNRIIDEEKHKAFKG